MLTTGLTPWATSVPPPSGVGLAAFLTSITPELRIANYALVWFSGGETTVALSSRKHASINLIPFWGVFGT